MVIRKPSLVGILLTDIANATELDHIVLVCNIYDGDSVFIWSETDFSPKICGIRTSVNHTLNIMSVSIIGVTCRKSWVHRIANINNVKSSITTVTSNWVGKSRTFVHKDIVRISVLSVQGICSEAGIGTSSKEFCEVEDLHAMISTLSNNEDMIIVSLKVSPTIGNARIDSSKCSQVDGIDRICDLDEYGSPIRSN